MTYETVEAEAKRQAKNKQIAATLAATRQKRKGQECRVFILKVQANKLNKAQAEALKMIFIEAKWLRNHLLAHSLFEGPIPTTVTVLTKDGKPEQRELKHVSGHLRQAVQTELKDNRKALAALKANGRRIGGLRFTSEVTSINLKDAKNTYQVNRAQHKLRLPKVGWLRVNGVEQLEGFELANAKLLNKPDGYYVAVTAFKAKEPDKTYQPGTLVGLDMGVKTHMTLSDGREYNLLVQETERLKRLQRKLSRQQKGSRGYGKTRKAIQREYQRMAWRKDDAANKLVHHLLQNELVFLQDESLAAWRARDKKGHHRNGRRLQHSCLGRVKAKLFRSDRVVVLRKNAATTQSCVCGKKNKHQLDERTYFCSSCGYTAPRDVHAAQNMVRMGWSKVPVGRRDVKPVESESDWQAVLTAFQLRSAKPEASGSSAQT